MLMLMAASQPALALNCASKENSEEYIPQNALIVRAKVTSIEPEFYIPYIQKEENQDQIVTFQILDVYKGPEVVPDTITAEFSNFFKYWGPHLKVGEDGEYLFDKINSDWVYSGPGGCTVVSEKAWQQLRALKRPHQ